MKSISQELISRVIKKRKSATHKGTYGRLLLIGGSKKYGGALIMAAEGALNSGAGLVTVKSILPLYILETQRLWLLIGMKA